MRWTTVETYCFVTLLCSCGLALLTWIVGMARKSFGAIASALWISFVLLALACAAVIGLIEFRHS